MQWIKNFRIFLKNKNRIPKSGLKEIIAFPFAMMCLGVVPAMFISILMGIFSPFRFDEFLVMTWAIFGSIFMIIGSAVCLSDIYDTLKKEYQLEYQKAFLDITNAIKEKKIFIKSLQKHAEFSLAVEYECVLDCEEYLICLYLKNGHRYCSKINKTTGKNDYNTDGISYYQYYFEDNIYNFKLEQDRQNQTKNIQNEASSFFSDVSALISSNQEEATKTNTALAKHSES